MADTDFSKGDPIAEFETWGARGMREKFDTDTWEEHRPVKINLKHRLLAGGKATAPYDGRKIIGSDD